MAVKAWSLYCLRFYRKKFADPGFRLDSKGPQSQVNTHDKNDSNLYFFSTYNIMGMSNMFYIALSHLTLISTLWGMLAQRTKEKCFFVEEKGELGGAVIKSPLEENWEFEL